MSLQLFSISSDVMGISPTFIFVMAIQALAIAVILRAKVMFLIQFAWLGGLYIIHEAALEFLFITGSVAQILITLFLIYRIKKALDYNYLLVMEKTHQIPRNITRNRNFGMKSSF
ncbi:hypothetical protein GWK91_09810 [Virgibacillus sp. MSP4-1]|uniref:hypothetical protein n=1 Tax=Virgibacillus sp. MSP4-1 TaxID=2700081 RepID=UPI00137C3EEF|nr:hypothetical protein [Virgibacillus sp. MSP4-1]QHS23227.1 hypothetical protein GWK91_09810 [Virgibacillus sp. MSP4-1]